MLEGVGVFADQQWAHAHCNGSTHSRVHDPVRVGPTAVDERHGWRDIENLRTRNAQEGERSNEGTHGSQC